MLGNPFNPYWYAPNPLLFAKQGSGIPRVDVNGIYELSTNAVQLSEGVSVDYGINPCCYNALPCESIVLLKVHTGAPTGGEALPVTVVTPNNGQSTVSGGASSSGGTSKIPVVDSNNNPVTGSDVTGSTERLAYINKRTGVIRFLEFTAGTTTAPTASSSNNPATANVTNAAKTK